MGPAFGPVGDIDDQIVFEVCPLPGRSCSAFRGLLPAPNRESQIITNKQQHLPAFDGCDETFLTRRIVRVFAGIGEAVAFVVASKLPGGKHPDEPVEEAAILFNDKASRENDLFAGGNGPHPAESRAVYSF